MTQLVGGADDEAAAGQAGELHKELGHAADEDADGEGQDRRVHPSREKHDAGDHADVQEGGADGCREEAAVDLEQPHGEGGQADQRKIREHHPGEEHGQVGLRGVAGEAGRDHPKDPRRRCDADDRGEAEHEDCRP